MALRKSRSPDRETSRRRGRKGAAASGARANGQGAGTKRSHSGRSGNAKANFDRYLELARAAAASGDAVASENYYQHAEHYLRLMREGTA